MKLVNNWINIHDFEGAAKTVQKFGFDEDLNVFGKLTKAERWKLLSSLSILQKASKSIAKELKQSDIDATDWDKLVREAKKRFSWLDIAILQTLEDGEYYLNYDGIEERLEDHTPQEHKHELSGYLPIRVRTRRMVRMGLIKYQKGLFNEDGEVAGSGFSLSKHSPVVRRIVQVFYPPKNEELDLE